jgi:hypothetical protein
MNEQTKLVPHPCRRYLRLSVRGLVVVVLLIGGWLGSVVRSARIQPGAVKAIEKAGGRVFYDWEWRDGKAIPGGRPLAPPWLVDRIGVDLFSSVTAVEFRLPYSLTDGPIVEFTLFPRLERLAFTGMTMSVAGLSNLRRLNHLRELDLGNCGVTDAELAYLKGNTCLRSLRLRAAYVSDVGLTHLEGMSNLASLDLASTAITGAGLSHLKSLTGLCRLKLLGTQIADDDLMHLQNLTNLQSVDVGYTEVTDAGLVHLGKMINLSEAGLAFTEITDAGLTHLKRMTKLSSLHIEQTRVTDAGVEDLLQALPKLKIHR